MRSSKPIQLIECPRDAMQGWPLFIPTEDKVRYINSLLKIGFHTIDFGSFVSPKAIPQMADTASVLQQLDWRQRTSRLLAIVANLRGGKEAVAQEAIHYLGFPFSISETFQQRNANSSIPQALELVGSLQELCLQHGKQLVVYISMAFGNPYGDPWSEPYVLDQVAQIAALGVPVISLADTVGIATPEQVHSLAAQVIPAYPDIEVGVHLHARPDQWKEKLDAALEAGCHRFDGALRGIGGCPMAGDTLVGNMNMLQMVGHFREAGLLPSLDLAAMQESDRIAGELFI